MSSNEHIETVCVHAGVEPDPAHGAVMTPIYQTSTYEYLAPGEHRGYDYSRGGNPTRTALETSLAALEGAKHAVSFSSGLAATQAVAQLLDPGAHVLLNEDGYGGTARLFLRLFARYGIEFEYIDMRDAASVRERIRPSTRLLWLETPTNPLGRLADIEAVAKAAKKVGALTVVDNTVASPIFQSPLELGADIVMHSSTKYIGGHSDLIGGALMLNDDGLADRLRFIQKAAGSVNSPQECFLLLRSIKTLAIRMKKHDENVRFVADFMERSGAFREVLFPGLKSHSQNALALRQMRGFPGLLSVRLDGGMKRVREFASKLRIFTLAESLGGVESLVNHPETMTHASVAPEHRHKLGITEDLIRFSVGIENARDLTADIEQALRT